MSLRIRTFYILIVGRICKRKKYNEGKSETCDFFLEYISDFSDDLYVVIIQIINKKWNSNEND